jgi:hypothetical protein
MVWIFCAFVVTPGCDGANMGGLNNGERGEISMAVGGISATHQPFDVLFFVQRSTALCGEAENCVEEVPIIGMAAGCEDERICSVQQQEPVEEGRRCRVVVDAHEAGKTRLVVEVETSGGEIRRDLFTVEVAAAQSVEVECARCESGMLPGDEAQARCSLYNRAVSDGPLMGSCDAWVARDGVEIIGEGHAGDAVAPHFQGELRRGSARAFGNVFTLRKTQPITAELVFSGGEVESRIVAR